MRNLILLILSLLVAGCGQPPDLKTPCPDYGRYCKQQAINTEPLF